MAAASTFAAGCSSLSRSSGRRAQQAFVAAPAQRLASVSSISAASSLAPAAAVRAPRCRAAAAVSVRSEITCERVAGWTQWIEHGLVDAMASQQAAAWAMSEPIFASWSHACMHACMHVRMSSQPAMLAPSPPALLHTLHPQM